MKNIFFSVVILTASFQLFADEAKSKLDECLNTANSNMAMKQCIYDEAQFQDQRLNEAYKKLMDRLKKDQSDDGKEVVSRIIAAEKAWIAFRDATCSVEGIDMMGGTGEGGIVGECVGNMTKERVDYITTLDKHLSEVH